MVPEDNDDQSEDIIRVNWELPVSSIILDKILRKTSEQKISSEKKEQKRTFRRRKN